MDEAHHLRYRAGASYTLVDGLNKRFLLLLSATPVQNDLIELYNLLTLLKPGIFKTLKEFRAAYMIAGKPRQPANPEGLRELMRGAMIRNTRVVAALTLPRRHATTIRVDGSDRERDAYEDLAAAVRGLAAGGVGRHRVALQHLLAAAGSSPSAATAAVTRFAARQGEEPAWRILGERWAALSAGAKEAALLELLRRNPSEKKLVFVHYRETLHHLAALLTREGIGFARFEGGLSGPDKDAVIADFRDRVSVLLCTESGGEGRNIQFCNTLINFDVPWNPMAIEQRIGRIDRIGQERNVFVFNLVTRGTLEERILHLLEEKISMFELVVGEVGAILGGLQEDRDFSDLVLDAWLETTEATRTEARCLLLTFRYTAVSDEKCEGLIRIGFNLATGAVVDEVVARMRPVLEQEEWQAPEPEVRQAAGPGWDWKVLQARLRPLLGHRVRQELEQFLAAMRRRLERARIRVHAYHDDLRRVSLKRLAALAGALGEKAQADSARERLRIAAIEREYQAKLNDLRHNYALRITVQWVQALELYLPVQRFDVLIRRRKGERLIRLDWHPAVRMAEPPPCDWGSGLGRVRMVCDQKLHLTEPAGQAPCPSCAEPWCRACHRTRCPACGR